MGSLALIRLDGKPVVVTHWDGEPWYLGRALLKHRPMNEIDVIRAVGHFTIDAVTDDFDRDQFRELRFLPLDPEFRSGVASIARAVLEEAFPDAKVIGPEDRPVVPLRDFRGWIAWEYDIKTKPTWHVKYREVRAWFRELPDIEKPWKDLTEDCDDIVAFLIWKAFNEYLRHRAELARSSETEAMRGDNKR